MTDTTPAVEEVIKTDALGRLRTPSARRESVLDEFERSGLSGKKFAALTGICPHCSRKITRIIDDKSVKAWQP